ncbi:hypothetical protein BJY01DRAFT_243281 [Aspergillus pseudoustus]|uniref:Uncharacterized protein n=1 Tax=Aspergillus pseudoustus TaxID=1810923 RepID=A0ABR4KVR2_9EURO
MCYYQPNAAGCTCVFLQLVQPCESPNVQYYPSPNPAANRKPLVKVCENLFIAKGVGQRACPKCLAQNQVQSQYQAQRRFSTAGSSLTMGAAAVGVVAPRTVIAVGQNAIIGNDGHSAGSVAWSNMKFGSISQTSSASTTPLPSRKRRGESLSRTLAAKRVSRSGPSFSHVSETATVSASAPITPSVRLVLPSTSAPPSLDMVGIKTPLASKPVIGGIDKALKTQVAQNNEANPQDSNNVADGEMGEMMSLLMSSKGATTPTDLVPVKKENEQGSAEHTDGRPRADSLFDGLDFDGGADQVAETKAEDTKMKVVKNDQDFPELSPIGEHDLWTMGTELTNEPVAKKIETEHE